MFSLAFRLLEYTVAENRRLWLLAAAFLAFNLLILPSFAADIMAVSQGTNVLDLRPWYSPDEALQSINAYGPEGRSIYLWAEWTADLLYPPTYSLLFGGLLLRLGGGRWSLLAAFSCLFDWIENVFVTVLLTSYPSFNPGIAQVAAIFTTAKWLTIFAMFMMLSVKVVEWGLRRLGSKTQIPTRVLVISLALLVVSVAVAILMTAGVELF